MGNIFTLDPSNRHQSLLLREPSAWSNVAATINRVSMAGAWKTLEFEFRSFDRSSEERPEITLVYIPGVLAFLADLRPGLFPENCVDVEFLPILVGSERWLMTNCLNMVRDFDDKRSQVMRGGAGEVYLVLRLHVTDPKAREVEMFTLAESNHSQLFVSASFKARVESLGLRGVTFRQIGETE